MDEMNAVSVSTTETTDHSESWSILWALLAAAFLGTLDTTVVNIALPTIQKYFHVRAAQVQLLGSGYILALASTLVIGGKLGDKYGRHALFRLGVVAFLVASAGCALAQDWSWLITLRVLQALSASAMVPQVLAIIKASFSRKAKVAISLYGTTLGMATISGMVLGGFLVDLAGWRSVFAINIPICVYILLAIRGGRLPQSYGSVRGVDIVGPALLMLTLLTIIIPLSFPAVGRNVSPFFVAVIVTVQLLLLAAYESSLDRRREGFALIPSALFSNPAVLLGMLTLAVYFVGTAGFNMVLAYHLQEGYHLSALRTGLLSCTLGLGFSAGSAVSHTLNRVWGRKIIVIGSLLMFGTRVLLPGVQVLSTDVAIGLISLLVGITGVAQGLIVSPLMDIILSSVATRISGVASGVLLTTCYCSMAIGQTVFITQYAGMAGQAGSPAAFAATLGTMAVLAGATALMASITLGILGRSRRRAV
jgi:MFS family permease